MLLYELKAGLNAYLAGSGQRAPVHSLKEIIEFNDATQETEMPYFGQDLFLKAEAKGRSPTWNIWRRWQPIAGCRARRASTP